MVYIKNRTIPTTKMHRDFQGWYDHDKTDQTRGFCLNLPFLSLSSLSLSIYLSTFSIYLSLKHTLTLLFFLLMLAFLQHLDERSKGMLRVTCKAMLIKIGPRTHWSLKIIPALGRRSLQIFAQQVTAIFGRSW